jgi:hypothetical protein
MQKEMVRVMCAGFLRAAVGIVARLGRFLRVSRQMARLMFFQASRLYPSSDSRLPTG